MSGPRSNHDLRRRPRKRPQIDAIFETSLCTRGEMPREVRSTRSRVRGSGEGQEEICRELAPDVQWLTIAVRAAERLMAHSPLREEDRLSNRASNRASIGRTNWHDWHTPNAAEQDPTGSLELAPQATAPPVFGACRPDAVFASGPRRAGPKKV